MQFVLLATIAPPELNISCSHHAHQALTAHKVQIRLRVLQVLQGRISSVKLSATAYPVPQVPLVALVILLVVRPVRLATTAQAVYQPQVYHVQLVLMAVEKQERLIRISV